MSAFGAHTYREVTRIQLASTIHYFTTGDERKMMCKRKEKHKLIGPLAKMFIKKTVMIKQGVNLSNSSIEDANKGGTF